MDRRLTTKLLDLLPSVATVYMCILYITCIYAYFNTYFKFFLILMLVCFFSGYIFPLLEKYGKLPIYWAAFFPVILVVALWLAIFKCWFLGIAAYVFIFISYMLTYMMCQMYERISYEVSFKGELGGKLDKLYNKHPSEFFYGVLLLPFAIFLIGILCIPVSWLAKILVIVGTIIVTLLMLYVDKFEIGMRHFK